MIYAYHRITMIIGQYIEFMTDHYRYHIMIQCIILFSGKLQCKAAILFLRVVRTT